MVPGGRFARIERWPPYLRCVIWVGLSRFVYCVLRTCALESSMSKGFLSS